MDQLNQVSSPPAASTPPTQPMPMASEAPKASWPTVIGIIAIVFGAGGLLSMASSLATKRLSHARMVHADAATREMVQSMETKMAPWTNPAMLIALVLAGLLLYAGIVLLRRKPSSALLMRIWAFLKIGFTLINAVVGYLVMEQVMAALAKNRPTPIPFAMVGLIGVVFAILCGCALPVFLLIWFSRRPVQEEMARWS